MGRKLKKIVDVWKHPHISYRKAFLLASIVTLILVAFSFSLFAAYIAPTMRKEMRVTFLSTEEVEKVVEEKQRKEEEKPPKEQEMKPKNEGGRGSGRGGQQGNSNRARRSDHRTSKQEAKTGEKGTHARSRVGDEKGDGLAGDIGEGVGTGIDKGEGDGNVAGTGAGNSDTEGSGVSDPGYFDASGYWNRLQRAAQNSYPRQAIQREIEGTVVVRVTFDGTGKVIDATAISGPEILRRDAEKKARSQGGAQNTTGEVKVVEIPIQYKLGAY